MTNGDNRTVGPAAGSEGPDADQRTCAMFCHLAALSVLFTGVGFVLVPLVVWLIKRDDMPFVDDQGKEALNFNITVFLVCVALRSDEHTSELQSLMRSSYAVFCLNNIITC